MKINTTDELKNRPKKPMKKPIKKTGGQPHSLKRQPTNQKYVDLGKIGEAVAKYVSKLTKHQISAADIRIFYLSANIDAICICSKQYAFFDRKQNRPDLTPMYFYNGRSGDVIKMGDTLGGLKDAVAALNKQGAGLVLAKKLLVK